MINNLRKGFTLIELLIVIVIIGVLAVTVLSAINPIEQIKKAQDAGKRSDSAELLNALERYYTAFQMYPWESGAVGLGAPGSAGSAGQLVATSAGVAQLWLSSASGLVDVDELKDEFLSRDNLQSLYVWFDSTTDLVRICFAPKSQTNMAQASWDANGTSGCTGTACIYQCVPE